MALTVTCTVVGAQEIGLSPSATAIANGWNAVVTGSVLPEQKTTPVLAPYRATELLASRKQPVETTRALGAGASESGRVLPLCQRVLFSYQSTAGETTRGPPLMDPPRFC